MRAYTLNAFSEDPNGGNPAGVVMDNNSLDENQMQKIAEIIGFSETAFIEKSNKADFKVRFFTPTEEVDFCGHATVASFYLLKHEGKIQTGDYWQETKAGVLKVSVLEDDTVVMAQSLPKFLKRLEKDTDEFQQIYRSLGISPEDAGLDFMEIVSTGLADLMVPVASRQVLDTLKPDFDQIATISRAHGITGYHVFVLKEGTSTAECRNFAPAVGIDEESATGSSSGALGAFLVKNDMVKKGQDITEMEFIQGIQMDRPSRIAVQIHTDGDQIKGVFVGGKAGNVQKLEVVL